LPGSTVGVLGSGQLGRMFAIAARRMGYRVHTFSPDQDTPTGQVADLEVTASYDDLDAVREFASHVDVVTFEFENVPAATAEAVEQRAPVRPSGEVLHITQHRLREKTWLAKHGFPVTPFRAIRDGADLQGFSTPAVLKTAGFGYDGKGQYRIQTAADFEPAWRSMNSGEAVAEQLVDFECELSVVAARAADGAIVSYAPSRNAHQNGILDVSTAPYPNQEAVQITNAVLEQLGVIGVLCVEFFLTKSGKLLVNELAPRPHNSGHLTIDSCLTSQFEQQLRAVCGLPLGSTEMVRPAAMANLLGDLWDKSEPQWTQALSRPEVKLHLYGKLEARPGRKMGHLTATGSTPEAAEVRVRQARTSLGIY
jgi:5-(carboxyamino)imidazole ribonucleotide synthase